MNIFISFAYTGTNTKQTSKRLQNIVNLVNSTNNYAYCNLFDKSLLKYLKTDDKNQIFKHTFSQEAKANYIFLIISKPKISYGQCMEVGVAVNLDIPIIMFEQNTINEQSYILEFAKHKYSWSNEDDLHEQILKSINTLNPRN